MVDVKRILCPVDLSEHSRHALEHALALGQWYKAPILVLHVVDTPLTFVPAGAPGNTAAIPLVQPNEVKDEVLRFCASALASGHRMDVVVKEGTPAKEIVRQAEELPADLLILGTHGRGGFERLVLGSVTEKVVRTTRRPVLTVPPRVETAIPGPPLYKTVLCPVDFSDASTRAVEYALSIAKEADARLILLHVLESLYDQAPIDEEAAHLTVPEYRRHVEQDATSRLGAAVPTDARVWCRPEEQLAFGKAYEEILRVAEESRSELIVMGVHSRSAVAIWLFGSTTHHVIRQATCPVLTLHA
jgi:nucleotide-binding universal stress UspA family protein